MGDGVKKLKKTSVKETLIADSGCGRGISRRCSAHWLHPRWIRCNKLHFVAATNYIFGLQFPTKGSCKKQVRIQAGEQGRSGSGYGSRTKDHSHGDVL